MSTADDPKDPRFRPFRAVSLGIYLVVTIGFSCLIIFSVYRSVLSMTPERPPVGELRSEEACLADARSLFAELEQQRQQAVTQAVARSDQRFLKFRVEWLTRKRGFEASCGLENRDQVRKAFSLLERALDLYSTASVQFAGTAGPTLDELKELLEPRP
jgi:hypothetical protein